ncbi:SanA/YdcF family protein [Paludibaculum fermentans]|uniref:YdcF family protein n=1 Tax=Paludibaculum fermentans TaxID=1473598 RepID=A0A7S7NXU6_PALFE|nr:ElyC/SanA/YdcF family protein [Paludibaculum fermentans]QOY91801.1 YdcF family protein [Paludibaculum fermentans]
MALTFAAIALVWAVSAWWMVNRNAAGRTYNTAEAVPPRSVGLVLGCSRKLPDGRTNAFFTHRIQAAAQLYRAGKVSYLLVSGDKHGPAYDEPADMRDSLIRAGVPADRIYRDDAGFSTRESILRARWIYGQTRLTVVSQEFHNQRAIWFARQQGIDAIGFNAAEVTVFGSFGTRVREVLARSDLMLDFAGIRKPARPPGAMQTIPI